MEAKIDHLDSQILHYLIDNARRPLTEIAKELLVSTATVHQRVRKLEKSGIIKGYSLNVDYRMMGYDLTVYVGIYIDNIFDSQRILGELEKLPEITVAHLASGKYSVFCKVRCKDTNHAKDILFRMQSIQGIKGTETMVMFEENINNNRRLLKEIIENSRQRPLEKLT